MQSPDDAKGSELHLSSSSADPVQHHPDTEASSKVLIGGWGKPEAGYSINTEFRFRIPPALSCSSRWSAPRRALIKSWFKAARNFREV
jgi:hypothetical protein